MSDAKKGENEENEENNYEKHLKAVAVEAERRGGAKPHNPNLFKNLHKPPPTTGRRRKTNAEKAAAKAEAKAAAVSASPSAAVSASPSAAAGGAGAGAGAAAAAPSRVEFKPEQIDANNNVIINSKGFRLAKKITKNRKLRSRKTRRHRTKQNRY